MQPSSFMLFLFFVLVTLADPVGAKGGAALRSARLSPAELRNSLGDAMGEAMGCGGQVDEAHLQSLEQALLPTWRVLAKTAEGNVERRSLRYLVHRHFSRRSALHIRGFEPSRSTAGWADIDILSQRVPSFVEQVLHSKHKLERGFDLRDAAVMVATLEQLVFDAESAVLEKVYVQQKRATEQSLSSQGLVEVLEAYMVHWMMGDDAEGIRILLGNRTLLETAFPHWESLRDFVHGEVESLTYRRRHASVRSFADASARPGHNALAQMYSFDDSHRVVGEITRSFASFWESECSSMKHALVSMDTHNTGRVPLAKFYNSALETDWRFGESEAYLRELGALDETSSWRGKQVLMANYIQATSNCIVSSPHYSVCCINDCEAHMEEIEEAVGAPTATASELLLIIGNMSSHMLLDDATPDLRGSLTQQLEEIAAASGGEVPLHGRLFAQFLHYVFPRECPFPHKVGTAAAISPNEFGDGYIARKEDMQKHVETAATANSSNFSASVDKDGLQWMSQWSPEEELVADHVHFRAPWERTADGLAWAIAASLVAAALYSAMGRGRQLEGGMLPSYGHSKSHYV